MYACTLSQLTFFAILLFCINLFYPIKIGSDKMSELKGELIKGSPNKMTRDEKKLARA